MIKVEVQPASLMLKLETLLAPLNVATGAPDAGTTEGFSATAAPPGDVPEILLPDSTSEVPPPLGAMNAEDAGAKNNATSVAMTFGIASRQDTNEALLPGRKRKANYAPETDAPLPRGRFSRRVSRSQPKNAR